MSDGENMNQAKYRTRYLYSGLIIVILVALFGILKTYIISSNGIYVIGTIDKVNVGRSGATVYIRYECNGKKYTGGFMPGYSYDKKIGRKIFVKVLPSSPTNFEYSDITVPDCILRISSGEKWKQIPQCP